MSEKTKVFHVRAWVGDHAPESQPFFDEDIPYIELAIVRAFAVWKWLVKTQKYPQWKMCVIVYDSISNPDCISAPDFVIGDPTCMERDNAE